MHRPVRRKPAVIPSEGGSADIPHSVHDVSGFSNCSLPRCNRRHASGSQNGDVARSEQLACERHLGITVDIDRTAFPDPQFRRMHFGRCGRNDWSLFKILPGRFFESFSGMVNPCRSAVNPEINRMRLALAPETFIAVSPARLFDALSAMCPDRPPGRRGFHEEGNVDQRAPTGREPHRHR